MIPRYSTLEMTEVWSDTSKWGRYLEVELLATEAHAEIGMVSRIGGDLVGMSTVPEAIAVRHMGARVMGISLCTNLAAGIGSQPLSHEEVKEVADLAHDKFTKLLHGLLPRLVSQA